MINFESLIQQKVRDLSKNDDPAHDFAHFKRVVKTAKELCLEESAKVEVVMPAAWLHDFVNVPKNDPRRSIASRLSAEAAVGFLQTIQYPAGWLAEIAHAIECHSFSANKQPETLEAKIVQDADRLDGLGAIGIARCFAVAGMLKRSFYSDEDPFCSRRDPDDKTFTIDHFYQKLFKTVESLHTASAKNEGLRRLAVMKGFLSDLKMEIGQLSPSE